MFSLQACRRSLLALAPACCFFLLEAAVSAEDRPSLERRLAGMEHGDADFRESLESATDDELDELCGVSDRTIALSAHWQKIRNTFRDEYQHPPVRIDRAKLQRFAGFVEGRLGIRPPSWWETLLGSLRYDSVQSLSVSRRATRLRDYRWTEAEMYVPRDISDVKRQGGGLQIVREERQFTIPESVLSDAIEELTFVSAVSLLPGQDERFFVAFHWHLGNWTPVYCIDGASGKVIWQAMANTILPPGASTGPLPLSQWIELRIQGKTLYVFGATDRSMFIDAFDMDSGKSEFRFSTAY